MNKKKAAGWILIIIYSLTPVILGFGKANSHVAYWGWFNIPFLIAIWELLARNWLLDRNLKKEK